MKNKKEQPMRQEPRLVIDITLTRGLLALLALVLVAAACLGYLAWGQKKATASSSAPAAPAASAPMRKYYLTQSKFKGHHEALTACAPGYYMASLWEILDPSELEYNTKLGFTQADSGAGPPTGYAGWVRTGWDSESDAGIPGQDNCAAWTGDGYADLGTIVYLNPEWEGDWEDMHVWDVYAAICYVHDTAPVWCVED